MTFRPLPILCSALSCLLTTACLPAAAQLTPPSAQSSGDPALSLSAVIERVQRDNPEIQALRQDEVAARALRTQAGLIPNPALSHERQRVPGGNRADATALSIPLEIGGQRGARIAAADRGTELARGEIAQSEATLRARTIQAFFDVVGAQDRETLAQGSQALAARATEVTGRRVRAGRASPVEEGRARVAEATAGIELSQARTELSNARSRLATLWGGGAPRNFVATAPEDRVPPALAPVDLERRVAQAPVLLRGRAEVERREALVRLARAEAMPATALQVGTGTLIENGQRVNHVGLSVTVPIFDRNQGNIEEARVRSLQARQALSAAELALRSAVEQAHARLVAARAEKELSQRTILPEADRALDATTRGYELGKFSFLEVLDAQRTLFAARAQSLRSLAEAYQAAAEIEGLLGPDEAAPFPPATPASAFSDLNAAPR